MSYEYLVNILPSAEAEADDSKQTARYYASKVEERKEAESIREEWARHRLEQRRLNAPEWSFWPWMAAPTVDLTVLPDYALFIQFRFRLSGAYLSKDERAFYIIDNPLRRDKLSQLPCVAATAWKGSLRAALDKLVSDDADARPVIQRLLGNEKGEQKDFVAGRLQFFPSFFTEQGVEIINPHDRERKVGKNPILMESVPAGAASVFSLLYFPLVQWKHHRDDETLLVTVAEDWEVLAKALPLLFCVYGFGAKTSSGHGIAHEKFAAERGRRRDRQPAGRIVAKFAPIRKPLEASQFEEEFGSLDEWSAAEWQELLERPDFVRYQNAIAAQEQQERIKSAGQVESEPETFTDLQQTLRDWAAEIRLLATIKGGRHA